MATSFVIPLVPTANKLVGSGGFLGAGFMDVSNSFVGVAYTSFVVRVPM